MRVASAADGVVDGDRGVGRVQQHALVGGPQPAQGGDHGANVGHGGNSLETLPELGTDLGPVDEEGRLALARNDGEAEHERRVGHVAATHVEQPADRFGQRQHGGVRAHRAQRLAQVRELVGAGSAGPVVPEELDGGDRGAGAAGPDAVDEVVGRRQPRAGLELFLEILDLGGCVQPRIVADDRVLGHQGGQLLGQSRRRHLDHLDQPGVGFGRRLQCIAAVDEQRGLLDRHQRQPGRAGEAGHVGQPRLAGRHRFAAVGIGPRNEEAVQPGNLQLRA